MAPKADAKNQPKNQPKNQDDAPRGAERRRTPRKDVLETFHVFLAIRKKGLRKIYIRDVSEGGIGLLVEPEDGFKAGETLEADFYINPSLKLPLKIRVAHLLDGKAGCEFVETSTTAFKAYKSFLALLDQLTEFID